jgi:hypothetical protein
MKENILNHPGLIIKDQKYSFNSSLLLIQLSHGGEAGVLPLLFPVKIDLLSS